MAPHSATKTKAIDRTLRILIVDDQDLIRKKVRSILEAHANFEVCGESINGAIAIKDAQKLKPDVVVLNIVMPVLNGFEAAREIRKQLPESAIIILSSQANQRFVEEARKIGVRSYVAKSKAAEALVKAIEAAINSKDFILIE
jgi:DNA-binding NarL/FixJ family response regulator